MKMIDKIRKATDEVIDELKWPLRVKQIERAAESFQDTIESDRLTSEQKLVDLQKKLTEVKTEDEARKIWKSIAEARIALEETDRLAQIVKKERDLLFGTVKE